MGHIHRDSSLSSRNSHVSSTSRTNNIPQVYPVNPNIQLRIVKNHQPEPPQKPPAPQHGSILHYPPFPIADGPKLQNINQSKIHQQNFAPQHSQNHIISNNNTH